MTTYVATRNLLYAQIHVNVMTKVATGHIFQSPCPWNLDTAPTLVLAADPAGYA